MNDPTIHQAARRAADVLSETLAAHRVERLYCVPGESFLALLDALHGRAAPRVITCRHEGGAGLMAVAEAKLTHRPAVVAVSRGPGASNAAIALHVAEQDAVPLVMLVGQVPRRDLGRGAFQEVDYTRTFSGMAKAVWEVHEADRLPEIMARAFHVAASATPGPVLVVLPEDVLDLPSDAAAVAPMPVAANGPSDDEIAETVTLLAAANRPLLIAGGAVGTPAGRAALRQVADRTGAPVALTFKRQDYLDNDHPGYAGHLGYRIPARQVAALAQADLIVAVGTRLTDVATQGYSFPRAPDPVQPLIHVHQDPQAIGRVFRTRLGVCCDPVAFLDRLAGRAPDRSTDWKGWAGRLHGEALALRAYQPLAATDGVDFGAVVAAIASRAAPDAILIADAGNFSSWVHAQWPMRTTNTMLANVGGAMGMGMPGAIAAGLVAPGRQALTFIGDGGLLMTGSELATAVMYGVPVKVFVSANRSYGTIRAHQERAYPGRVVGTDLANPSFADWARAFGAAAHTIRTAEDIEPAVEAALAASGPVVVEVHTSLEAISAYTTLSRLGGRA